MAVISKGIKLFKGDVELTNLQEVAELGGTAESIEVTVLSDPAHVYTNGLLNYGDSLDFKFLYEKTQFMELNSVEGSQTWKVELPDTTTCTFGGTCSVKLDGVGVNAALTYTLSIKPDSAMVWA
jgi:ABC-type dipeptide/oligopeptide/nickel transport system ATPase component